MYIPFARCSVCFYFITYLELVNVIDIKFDVQYENERGNGKEE